MKTPQLPSPALAKMIGVRELWLKREDQHHFGSHKGRSIPHMIHAYHREGWGHFVISSSGNAALAAALYVQDHTLNNPTPEAMSLTIFVGERIDKEKLNVLRSVAKGKIGIRQVKNPKQSAFQMDRRGEAKLLRQSTDDLALAGYDELAKELNRIPNLRAIFIPTSSGTAAQGLGEAFRELDQKPQLHIVQTTSCHPIAEACGIERPLPHPPLQSEGETGMSVASAIVDMIAYRKNAVAALVKSSGGGAWIVSDEDIRAAMKLCHDEMDEVISPNSALSIAGLMKAVSSGKSWDGAVVCILTGR